MPPETITESGFCPACEGTGVVGNACPTASCARYGYHFIPEHHFERRIGKGRLPDRLIGLDFGGYLVFGALGEGGIGKVYRAWQRSTGMAVALKVLKANANQLFRDRFEGEAKALASLAHPNIVGLRDFGTEHGQSYIVMEFIEGQTLKDFLRTAPDLDALLPIFEALLDALEYAHHRDIIHRDIKPENIMLQAAGNQQFVRLLDFGLAKDIVDSDATSLLGGTPAYMAPEQMRRVQIGPWTDLFAVGCMAYEALIAERPYAGMSPRMRDLCKADKLDYNPAAHLSGSHAPEIARFLQGALAHDPAARFRHAEAFRQAMRAAFGVHLGRTIVSAPPVEPSGEGPSIPSLKSPSVASPAHAEAPRMHPAARPAPRRAGLWVALACVGLAILAVAYTQLTPEPEALDTATAGVSAASRAPMTGTPASVAPATLASTAPITVAPTAPITVAPTAPMSAAAATESSAPPSAAPETVAVAKAISRAAQTRTRRSKSRTVRRPRRQVGPRSVAPEAAKAAAIATAAPATAAPATAPPKAIDVSDLRTKADVLNRKMRDCKCERGVHEAQFGRLKTAYRRRTRETTLPRWLSRLTIKKTGPGKTNCSDYTPPPGWQCRYGEKSRIR